MPDMVLKLPLGPAIALRAREFGAVLRHRYMLFFYLGSALLGMVSSAGATDRTPHEIIFALAVLQVALAVIVMVVLAQVQMRIARRFDRPVVLRLGWLLVAGAATAVGSAEVCDHVILGEAPTPLLFLGLQLFFYASVALVTTSALLQFAMQRMLADLRAAEAAVASTAAFARGEGS